MKEAKDEKCSEGMYRDVKSGGVGGSVGVSMLQRQRIVVWWGGGVDEPGQVILHTSYNHEHQPCKSCAIQQSLKHH